MKFGLLLLAATLSLWTPRAQAEAFGTGEQVAIVSPLKEMAESSGIEDISLAYQFQSVRVFGAPIFSWGGKYVYYSESLKATGENPVQDITAEDMKKVEASLGSLTWKGGSTVLLAKYVDYLWIALVVLILLVVVLRLRKRKSA